MTKFTKNKQEKNIIITIKRLGINGEGIGYYKKKRHTDKKYPRNYGMIKKKPL